MNQEKIGKFIADLRKSKAITQTELAKRIGVSNKTVSKWECGNSIPDYGVFENLCKEFDISINELLNGEKDMKDDKVIGEYMKMKSKQSRNKIIVVVIISFLVLLSTILSIYFFNSYDKTNIYELRGDTVNFSFDGGLLVSSNIKNIFQKGTIQIKNDYIEEGDIAESYFAFKVEDKLYKLFDYYNRVSVSVEDYGEDSIIPTKMKDYIPNNLYLIVVYYKDEQVYVEQIKIKSKKIFSNNKFINLKSDPSNDAKLELVIFDNLFDPFIYKKQLLAEGFVEASEKDSEKVYGSDNLLVKKNDKEEIFIDYLNYDLYYYVENDDYIITSVPTHDLYQDLGNDFIGGVDLYLSYTKDEVLCYKRIYSCHRGYMQKDYEVDVTEDIERFEEVNRLYAYKGE